MHRDIYEAEMNQIIDLKDLKMNVNPEESEMQQLEPPSPTKKDEMPIFDPDLFQIDVQTGYPLIYQQ